MVSWLTLHRPGYHRISGLQMMNWGIPRCALRGTISVNMDCAWVDSRRWKRAKRRFKERYA